MNRRYTTIVVALFAIAALEFGLLGANAAGITGGGGGELPPVGQRLGVPATDTPAATPTVLSEFHIPQVDLTGASLQANPLTIRCNGLEDSIVTVRLLQPNGDPPPDGTPVYPSTYNGNASPYVAYTHDGHATFSVRFYDDIFPSGPNFIISSGLLEAGIRIRCNPNSNGGGCSMSPPSVSPPCATPTPRPNCFGSPPQASPPCPTPTPPPDCFGSPPQASPPCPPTPYPCNPSPNSGPLSPPCATPELCGISPQSVSPPCEPTPTPYPCSPSPLNDSVSPPCNPATPFVVAVDCDVDEPGVQSYCVIPPNQNYDAAIVLINNSGSDTTFVAFNFSLFNSDVTSLSPLPSAASPLGLDGNPDFNQLGFAGGDWQCAPVIPDRVPNGVNSESLLSCLTIPFFESVPNGATVTLGTVHYNTSGSGVSSLRVGDVALYDAFINELGSCPVILAELTCTSAFVEIGAAASTPTAPVSTPPVETSTPAPQTATATRPARTSTPLAATATRPPATATVVRRTPTVAAHPTRRPDRRCADVNGDGRVSIRDVKLIASAVLRRDQNKQFDVNGDGRVSQRDVVRAITQLGRRC